MLKSNVAVRADWLPRAFVAGFVGTVVMLFAFLVAQWSSIWMLPNLDTGSREWVWLNHLVFNPLVNLAHNSLYLAMSFHLLMGIVWALIYAWAEPHLGGAGYWRGLKFALLPWVLSLVFFFPVLHAGFAGVALGAGPLPALGNLVLHGVYGLVLGGLYSPLGDMAAAGDGGLDRELELRAGLSSERHVALGLVIGLIVGAITGGLLVFFGYVFHQPDMGVMLFTMALGGALGTLLGLLVGLPTSQSEALHRARVHST
ncbi:MAG: DUF6789 family protein [Candidatus Xenobia bacterium]